jgi:hypothetical protein
MNPNNSNYNNDEMSILNNTHLMIQNTDNYVWFRFQKRCGYSIMFPFVLDDSIQALYRHIDLLWKTCPISLIWFVDDNNRELPIMRGDHRPIRQFIIDHKIYRSNFGIIYNVRFEIDGYHNFLYHNTHNDHRDNGHTDNKCYYDYNNHKNIN